MRWPDKNRLLATFHINRMVDITRNPRRCYFTNAPTLAVVNLAYGNGTAQEWLTYMVTDISEFSGARNKITPGQITQLVQLITGNYWYLNMAEIMLFCRRFKSGCYGSFYSSVDPMTIMAGLKLFVRERAEAYNTRYAEQAAKRLEEQLHDPANMDYYEWQIIHQMQREYEMIVPGICNP